MHSNTIIVSGYSRAPAGTPMHERYKYAGVVLEIDPNNHVVIRAECTFVTDIARTFFQQILANYDLKNGLGPLVAEIERRYWAPSEKALIMALRAAYQRYVERMGGTFPRG